MLLQYIIYAKWFYVHTLYLYQTNFIVFAWSVVTSLCIYFDNFVKLRQTYFYIWRRQSYKLRCNLPKTCNCEIWEKNSWPEKNNKLRTCLLLFHKHCFISIYSYHFRVIIEYMCITLYLYKSLLWCKWHKTLVYYYRWTDQAEAIYIGLRTLLSKLYSSRTWTEQKQHTWSLTDLIQSWFCVGHGDH